MADLSDDISSLLHTLLHNSSQPSNSSPTHHQPPHDTRQPGSGIFSDSIGLFDSGFGFSETYYCSGAGGDGSVDEINEADCENEEHEDTRVNKVAGRSSSKRSRAAQVHNLSEKRRRQRINEKMKALQKLIPNSNKTDKASMLDEAIEYLKQLQLQVQMLTMRNGSSLHPYYLPGVTEPLQQPQVAPLLDESNNNRGVGSFNTEQEDSMQVMFDLARKPDASVYKQFMPRMTPNNNLGNPLVLEPFMSDKHYSASSSKVHCKKLALPHLQLDMSHRGESSSSGISS